MSDFPSVPAAHINAIAEEGTKADAVKYMQKHWDELCWLKKENKRIRQEVDRLKSMFSVLPQEHFEKFKSVVEGKDE
jgi:hypothetical protein